MNDSNSARFRNDFSQGSIPRTIMRLALPMIGAQIINALYNMVDRMFIGRIADASSLALTGVGLTFPIINIVSAFANLCGMGGAPLCSIARGEGKPEYAERVMGSSFALLVVFSVILTVLGLVLRVPVLRLFGASANTLPYADAYISIYLCGTPFVMMSLGMNPFIGSQGFARVSMFTVLIGAVTNIILDPIFIFTLNMGVRGAALATIISQLLCSIWAVVFLSCRKPILRLRRENIKLDWTILKRVVSLGLSNFTMACTESATQIACNTNLAAYGGDMYIGAMTVISSIRQFTMLPLSGIGSGAQPVIGYNYGANQPERVKKSIKFLLLVCVLYATLCWALIMAAPQLLMSIFTNDPALIEIGVPAVRIYFCLFFMMCFQMAGQNSFVALNKAKQATFFSLLRKAFIVVPLVILLPRLTNLGVMGVFVAEPISDVVGSLACFITFMLTVWKTIK